MPQNCWGTVRSSMHSMRVHIMGIATVSLYCLSFSLFLLSFIDLSAGFLLPHGQHIMATATRPWPRPTDHGYRQLKDELLASKIPFFLTGPDPQFRCSTRSFVGSVSLVSSAGKPTLFSSVGKLCPIKLSRQPITMKLIVICYFV